MARDPTHGAGPTILLFDRDRAQRLVSLEERPGASASRTSCGSTSTAPDGLDELADTFDLDEETRAAFSDASTVTSFRDQGHYVHVTVNAPDSDAGDSPIEVECVVGDQWVVTAHERPVPVLEAFTELAEGSGHTGELDGTGFLAALLEWVLHEFAAAFERLEQRLEEVGERAMHGKRSVEAEIDELVELRRHAAALRRALVAHRPMLLALTQPEFEALCDERSAKRFRALLDRHAETVQLARDARESIVSLVRRAHRAHGAPHERDREAPDARLRDLPARCADRRRDGDELQGAALRARRRLLGCDRRDRRDRVGTLAVARLRNWI